ncbi:MAG: hypothetical protein Q4B10_07165 [Actinomycetaceae bacterium]|nr:hypothetical protein [Actinomycetaceae bacterium]
METIWEKLFLVAVVVALPGALWLPFDVLGRDEGVVLIPMVVLLAVLTVRVTMASRLSHKWPWLLVPMVVTAILLRLLAGLPG